jgi:ribosome modulation factor
MMPISFRRGRAVVFALLAAKSVLLTSVAVSYAEMPHNRRCDIAQDNPGNLNPAGGNAIMFGLCSGIQDLPTGEEPSRHHTWNAFNCGYQAYRQGKVFGANPYYNDDLETRWSEGWKAAQKACKTGKGPFD